MPAGSLDIGSVVDRVRAGHIEVACRVTQRLDTPCLDMHMLEAHKMDRVASFSS